MGAPSGDRIRWGYDSARGRGFGPVVDQERPTSMLRLSADARARMEGWVRAGYPRETCGVLVGREAHGLRHVLCAVPGRNRDEERSRERYELDPGDLVAADMEARAQGLATLGIWHSHPDQPAEPSETDRVAAWEGWSYVILSVSTRGIEGLRCWRLLDGRFREEELETLGP